MAASTSITQHIAVIFIFLSVFVRLKERLIDPRIIIWLSVFAFLLGYFVWETLVYHSIHESSRYASRQLEASSSAVYDLTLICPGAKAVKSSILVFLALLALSPLLRTLTAATSSDSIWALSAILFILNVLLADYSTANAETYHRERYISNPTSFH